MSHPLDNEHNRTALHDILVDALANKRLYSSRTQIYLDQLDLLKAYYKTLPDNLKSDVVEWGINDTVVRENIATYASDDVMILLFLFG